MDASIFNKTPGSHLRYLELAYSFLIESYEELKTKGYNSTNNNENKIRDDLVKIAKTKKKTSFPFRWISEFPDIEKNNRIDIDLATPQSLIDESNAIKIECKIVGEDKYIDTVTSTANGIMSFITGKYADKMPLAGMIGFIKEKTILSKVDKIQKRVDKHLKKETLQNLEYYEISGSFKYSYYSKHKRSGALPEISIYHLFFDFT